MPFKPLSDQEKTGWKREMCNHPEHKPPMHIVLKPGLHIWVCPACGQEQPITVPHYTWYHITLGKRRIGCHEKEFGNNWDM